MRPILRNPHPLFPSLLLIAATLAPATTPAAFTTEAKPEPLTLTLCGPDTLAPNTKDIDTRLTLLRSIGATSIQSYIYWNRIEKSPGELDWSAYDQEALKFKEHGLKWVPFVIMGPWYVTPEFVRQDPQITMYRCLEHGRDSKIPSLWCPRMREYIRTYLQRFAEHYRPMGVLESVNIGITGDYGEAIYSVIGNWPGAYHSHGGYWCGDPLAEADFRHHVQNLYPEGIAALNIAWRTSYKTFAEVKPFSPAKAPSERAWQEFLAWYRGAMTEFAEFCLAATREAFPESDIYLCTGGDMAPEHGSDFSAQAKVSAKYRAGIRITNEGSSYPVNVRYTRMVATASRHYGNYFGLEPAAIVTPRGMVGRIFNAVTSGANQLFTYYTHDIVDDSGSAPALRESGLHLQRYRHLMNQIKPQIETAVYQANPSSQQVLSADVSYRALADYGEMLTGIRRFIDYDLVDDRLIEEGILDGKKILLVAAAQVMDARTTERIADWVRRGGILFALASRPVDWDGSTAAFDALAGFTSQTDEINGISTDGILVPSPEDLPSIAALKDVFFTRAYSGLAPDAEILLGMVYAPQAGVAWRRQFGKGVVFTYFGPMDLKQDESSWVPSHRMPLLFMRDGLQACIREKRLNEIPPSLILDTPDVFKVMTDSGLWHLNMGDQPRTVVTNGQQTMVPPLSIVQPHP